MRALFKNAAALAALAAIAISVPSFAAPAGSASQGLAAQASAAILPPASASQLIGTIGATGDSLTDGNLDGSGVRYPDLLSTATGYSVLNLGIAGQSSAQIAARTGAQPLTLTISGNSLPANGSAVSVTAIDGNSIQSMATNAAAVQPLSTQADISTRYLVGTLCGVRAVLKRTASGGPPSTSETYTVFVQPTLLNAVSCAANSTFTPAINTATIPEIIWWGRNDYATPSVVKAAVTAEIARHTAAGNSWYLCGSVLPGNYAAEYTGGSNRAIIDQLNSDLQGICGASHWVNVLAALQSGYNPSLPQDVTDVVTNGITPSSLRYDALHPNAAGFPYVEAAFAAKLSVLLPAAPAATLTPINIPSILTSRYFLPGGLSIGCSKPASATQYSSTGLIQFSVCGGSYYLDNGAYISSVDQNGNTVAVVRQTNGTIAIGGTGALNATIGTGGTGGTAATTFQNNGDITTAKGLTVGSATDATTAAGEVAIAKAAASGTAPGAGFAKLGVVCGTTAGTAKLVIYGGTSTTPSTLIDNVGAGVTGC